MIIDLVNDKLLIEKIIKRYKIYVDMDGTIVDFEGAWHRFSGESMTFEEYEAKYGKPVIWEKIKSYGIDFWSTMEWLPDGKKLWEFVKPLNPTLLTTPARYEGSKIGKLMWRDRELPTTPLIFSNKKFEYANKDSILIDDFDVKVNNWIEHGGIGILHKSADESISALKIQLFDK